MADAHEHRIPALQEVEAEVFRGEKKAARSLGLIDHVIAEIIRHDHITGLRPHLDEAGPFLGLDLEDGFTCGQAEAQGSRWAALEACFHHHAGGRVLDDPEPIGRAEW